MSGDLGDAYVLGYNAGRAAEREQIVCFLDDLADAADDAGYRARRDTISQIKHQIQRGEHISD